MFLFRPQPRTLRLIFAVIALWTSHVVMPQAVHAQNQLPPLPQLSGDFTLRYAATQTQNQNAAAKENLYRTNVNSIDAALKEGKMTRAEADHNKAALKEFFKHDLPPQHFSVMLSSHNGKLLYRTEGDTPIVLIWDNKNAYLYDTKAMYLNIEPSFGFGSTAQFLCPGAGLPGIPVIKLPTPGPAENQLRGDIYAGYVQYNGPLYLPGILHFAQNSNGSPRLTDAEWQENGQLKGRCEFSGTAPLGDIPLARQIKYIQYNPLISHAPGKPPEEDHTVQYKLTASSNIAVTEDQFDPRTYFPGPSKEGQTPYRPIVSWSDSHSRVEFRYDPTKPLDQQITAQLQLIKTDAAQQTIRENKRKGIAGPILIVFLFIGVVWWLMRRKGSQTS